MPNNKTNNKTTRRSGGRSSRRSADRDDERTSSSPPNRNSTSIAYSYGSVPRDDDAAAAAAAAAEAAEAAPSSVFRSGNTAGASNLYSPDDGLPIPGHGRRTDNLPTPHHYDFNHEAASGLASAMARGTPGGATGAESFPTGRINTEPAYLAAALAAESELNNTDPSAVEAAAAAATEIQHEASLSAHIAALAAEDAEMEEEEETGQPPAKRSAPNQEEQCYSSGGDNGFPLPDSDGDGGPEHEMHAGAGGTRTTAAAAAAIPTGGGEAMELDAAGRMIAEQMAMVMLTMRVRSRLSTMMKGMENMTTLYAVNAGLSDCFVVEFTTTCTMKDSS